MPSIRRRARVRREDFQELTPDQKRHLLKGRAFFNDGFKDLESFSLAWSIHGPGLLPEFIEKHPGSRPFAWWICDHKKELPPIATWATPEHLEMHRGFQPNHFGFLYGNAFGGGEWMLQLEQDYLYENGLMTPEEIEMYEAGEMEDLTLACLKKYRTHCDD